MSLRRIKTLYCVAVISIALILACTGGLIGWVASIVLLGGALPMFRAMWNAGTQEALDKSERTADLILASLTETDDHQATQAPNQATRDRSGHRPAGAR